MIPIKKEPKDMYKNTGVYENCVFCTNPTDTWHERTNNPVCENCAKTHKVNELNNHFKRHKTTMSDKIKYCTDRNGEYKEFPLTVTRIILPNGDEYTLRYDTVRDGLIINKAYSDNDSIMTITPCVSNEILLQ